MDGWSIMENPIKNGWFGGTTGFPWFSPSILGGKIPLFSLLPVCMMRCCIAPEAFCRITSCCTTWCSRQCKQNRLVDDMQPMKSWGCLMGILIFRAMIPIYIYIYIVSIILYSKQPGLTRKYSKHFNISRDLSRWKKKTVLPACGTSTAVSRTRFTGTGTTWND